MKTSGRVMLAGTIAIVAALAQGVPGGRMAFPVHGQVSASGPLPEALLVEIRPDGSGATQHVTVSPDGGFEFHAVFSGTYELRVLGAGGRLIHQEYATIGDRNQLLSIRLPDAPAAGRSSDTTVSMGQLTHKVPTPARKAYEKGRTAAGKGYWDAAATYFLQAVSLDPDFAAAHNDLGATYLSRGELPQAAEQFQKAIDSVPDHRRALSNLTVTFMRLKQYDKAGDAARRTLRVDPGQARAHLILAACLMRQTGAVEEALLHLKSAAAEIPGAHLMAAEVLMRTARNNEAQRQLEEYLRVVPPQDAERAKAESLLARIQQERTDSSRQR
jgi:tetratricopeptide (TPR) repeat protein